MRYRKEILTYLKDDLRLDMDAFFAMDATIFEACAALGKKASTMKTIAKLLRDQRSEIRNEKSESISQKSVLPSDP